MIRIPDNQSRYFRGISALLLIVLCGLFVLPVPVADLTISSRLSGKDSSVPFPCMRKPCGCRSAAECWRKCCCLTNTQKLAWAEQNNVTVPGYVLDAAVQEQQEDDAATAETLAESSKPTGSAESSHADFGDSGVVAFLAALFAPTVPDQQTQPSEDSCADQTQSTACCGSRGKSVRLVSTVQALQCRGISLAVSILSTMLVPSTPSLECPGMLPGQTLALMSDPLPDTVVQAPVPPPRLSGV